MKTEVMIKILESVFTIDGKGRPEKAKMMLTLLTEVDKVELMEEIRKISERKFM